MTDEAETKRVAEMLCNCAKSRGGHSTYCPSYTALRKLGKALDSHRARMMGQ
jgi:hypothetical protein